MFEDWFGAPVDAVSYHRPSETALSSSPDATTPRPHTYLPLFTEQMLYRSDSRGQWKHGHPQESKEFQQRKPLHILVHPIWWQSEVTDPHETLSAFAQRMHESQELEIARNCKTFRVGRFAGVTNE